MEKEAVKKDSSGISLISIILTIIIIIILAAISMKSISTHENASEAKYVHEFEELRKCVETQRLINTKKGIEYLDNGFSKVNVIGDIPYNFMTVSNNDNKVAYLISLDYVGCDEMSTGRDYKRFESSGDDVKTVQFGVDDVYVYDSTGQIYYAKGFLHGDTISYGDITKKGSINIVRVDKEFNSDKTNVKATITIESENEIKHVIVTNDKFENNATKKNDTTYEITIDKNGTYKIFVQDNENNSDEKTLVISGIGSENLPTVTATIINSTLEDGVYKVNESLVKLQIESNTAKYLHISDELEDIDNISAWLPYCEKLEKYYGSAGEKTIYVWVKDENGNVCETPYELNVLIDINGGDRPTPPEKQDLSGNINFVVSPDNETWSKTKEVRIIFSEGKQSNGYTSMYQIGTGRWTIANDNEVSLNITKNNTEIKAKITYSTTYQSDDNVASSTIQVTKLDRTAPTITSLNVIGTKFEVEAYDSESGIHSSTPYLITTREINFNYITNIDEYEWISEEQLRNTDITESARNFLYVRDNANNINYGSVLAGLPDTLAPEIIEAKSQSVLDYSIVRIVAKDDKGITGYAIVNGSASSQPDNWTNISSEEYLVLEFNNITEDGNYTVWLRDAAGNVSHETVVVRLYQFPLLADGSPVDLYVKEGTSNSFSILMSEDGYPNTYKLQWQVSSDGIYWTDIAGANEATYTFIADYGNNNKQYRCRIEHARGDMYSSEAKLEVVRITKDEPDVEISVDKELVLAGAVINNGDATTNNSKLSIEIIAINAVEMNISETTTKGTWQRYNQKIDYTLTNTIEGNKTLYIWVKDLQGNELNTTASIQYNK